MVFCGAAAAGARSSCVGDLCWCFRQSDAAAVAGGLVMSVGAELALWALGACPLVPVNYH